MTAHNSTSQQHGKVTLFIVWVLKVAFFLCATGVITLLLMPAPALSAKSGLTPWDKADHFIVFYSLTLIAIAAFPKFKLRYLTLALACVGFAIEGAQPLVGRDASVADGLANTFGILAVTIPVALSRWRRAITTLS